MKKREIYLPKEEEKMIPADRADDLFGDEGVIFVYNKKEVLVGAVVKNNDTLILNTIDNFDTFGDLESLLTSYTEYKFFYCN